MKIAILADTHLGIRNNSEALLDCQERFYQNIFFPELEKRKIKTIVHLGDYFDSRKNLSHLAFSRNEKHFLNPFEEGGYEMYIIAGNHDCFYTNTNKINSLRNLLSNRKGIYIMDMFPEVLSLDGGKTNSLFVPWLNAENLDAFSEYLTKDFEIDHVFGHFEINGFDVQKGHKMETGWDRSIFKKFPIVFSGHFHHKNTYGNIHYLGSNHQATWSDYDSERGFHIFDTVSNDLEFIKNPDEMFKVIKFDSSKKIDTKDFGNKFVKVIVENKQDENDLTDFLKELGKNNPENVSVIDSANVSFTQSEIELQEGEKTLETINKFIDTIDDCNIQSEVKKYINNIYTEGLNHVR